MKIELFAILLLLCIGLAYVEYQKSPNENLDPIKLQLNRETQPDITRVVDSLNDLIDSLQKAIRFETATFQAIAWVESRHDSNAIGDGGKAYGMLQMHSIAVEEVNRVWGTNFNHDDAFNPRHATDMFWMIMTQAYQKDPDWNEMIQWWNGGPSIRNANTTSYLQKVKNKIPDYYYATENT